MTWAPNVPTEEEIEGFVEDLMAVTPEILGIDETLPGCEVIDMNPYGVPAGTLPRYIKVAIRQYYQDAFYRGGLTGLSVGDYVTVTHLREGNRYEVTGAGGSGGTVPSPPPNPVAQGQALVSDAVPEWVASLTPTWLGNHTWGSGFALMPTDATGQGLGDATHRWDLHTQAVYFDGATGTNIITVPDNVADALHISDVGGLEHLRIVSTNANPYFLIDPAGAGVDVGIATLTPEGKLDVAYGGAAGRMTLLLGADLAASTRTNVTSKRTLIGSYHYTNAEEPVGMMYAFSSNILNRLDIGGGTIFFNAATRVSIYTAANTTTQAGTERFRVDSTGAIIVTGPSLTVPAAWNLIVPDNVADALGLEDVGGLEYMRIVSTNAQPATTFNSGGVDIDLIVQAVGVADALVVQGSDGQITLGVLTAGYVKSSAGGVLSVAIEVPLVDLGSYTQGDLIYGGAADWQDLAIGAIGDFLWVNAAGTEPEWHTLVVGDIPAHALLGTQHSDTTTDAPTQGSLICANATPLWDELLHPLAAGYALTTDATDVMWDQTPAWMGEHSFAAGIAFTGASGANEVTVPDNTAIALELLDAGGLEYVRINSTNANPYFLIDPVGGVINFGIGGLTAPVARMQIASGAEATSLILGRFRAAAFGAYFIGQHSRNATVGGNTIVQNNDEVFSIVAKGNNGTGYTNLGMISFQVDGAPGAVNDMPGRIVLYTTPDGSGTLTKRMTVDSAGLVGIGCTPAVCLDILDTTTYSVRVASVATDVTNKAGKFVGRHYTNAEEDVMGMMVNSLVSTSVIYIGGGSGVQNAATEVRLYTAANNTTTTGTVRVTVNSVGNVGIGAAPGAKLDVDGGATDDPLTILDALSDDDSAFINFKGVSAADNTKSISTLTVGIFSGRIRIQINGVDRWIPFYVT